METYSHVSSIARADAAAAIGLTEISKQMRKMRATNQKQKEELHRQKKQLEVLTETRGLTMSNVQSAFENAALKNADKELQRRYKKMKIRAEEAEAALQTRDEDKGLHERIADLEMKAAIASENDCRSQQQLKELYGRLKGKDEEKAKLQQEILALNKQKQDAVLKSASVDVQTTQIIKSLQNRLAEMDQERKQMDQAFQALTWENEQIKQSERRAVLEAEKCYIELSSKVVDIADLEQRLASLHFAYTLVEKDIRDEQKIYKNQKAQQEAADLALVQTIVKSNEKMNEEKQKQRKLEEKVAQVQRKLSARSPVLPSPSLTMASSANVTMVKEPARVLGVIEKKSSSRKVPKRLAKPPTPRSSRTPTPRSGRTPSPKTPSQKAPSETCDLAIFANARCDACNTPCCNRTGARIADSRVCSVCALFYCPSCKRQNLTRRGPKVYKHPQCVGSKTQYLYPY